MVTLFLMGKKGYDTIQNLTGYFQIIDNVVIARDLGIKVDYFEEIKSFCLLNNIRSIERKDINEGQFKSNYLIAISWRWLIKVEENQQLIVLHDSILPRLRGFNPLVTALINGDTEIGVTALFAVEEFDKGDIIDIDRVLITYPIAIKKAIDIISGCYVNITKRLFEQIENRRSNNSKLM